MPEEWKFDSSEEEGQISSDSSDWEPDFSNYKGRIPTYYVRPKKP